MMIRKALYVCLCAIGSFVIAAGGVAHAEGTAEACFHEAHTEPEKTLDHIIRRSEHGTMSGDVLGLVEDPEVHIDYSDMFTKDLLKSLLEVEKRVIQENCGGHLIEGQLCAIDENPISCGQDADDKPYLYHTIWESDHKAVITLHLQEQLQSTGGPVYRLIKTGGVWKIDAIHCDDDLNDLTFNQ